MTTDRVCFISDAHFGIDVGDYYDRETLFFRFLEREIPSLSRLYILGDLFDFWIEYRHAIRPDYFTVLHHLKRCVDAGVQIHYLAGNHDFALGPFLTDVIGMNIYPGSLVETIQDRRILMFHGDGLIRRDIGYLLLKKLLRNRVNQWFYRLLHPGIGVPLGSAVSGSSRKYLNKPLSDELRAEYAACARQKLTAENDIVMFGHIHEPQYIRWPEGIYCNTGAWLKHCSYAVMEGGELSLRRYREGSGDEVVPAISIK